LKEVNTYLAAIQWRTIYLQPQHWQSDQYSNSRHLRDVIKRHGQLYHEVEVHNAPMTHVIGPLPVISWTLFWCSSACQKSSKMHNVQRQVS